MCQLGGYSSSIIKRNGTPRDKYEGKERKKKRNIKEEEPVERT
jgi:hypothetical protein